MMILLFIFSVVIASFSQILLKKGSMDEKSMYFNKNTIIGYMILVVSTFFTALAYRKVDLSVGVILESLSYIFVPLLSYFILKEHIEKRKIWGMILIIIGIIIFSL